MNAARAAIAVGLVCCTAVSLALVGLNTTSALIQLLLFACALAGWIAAGARDDASMRVRRIRSRRGSIVVRQRGGRSVTEDVDAHRDVTIVQRDEL